VDGVVSGGYSSQSIDDDDDDDVMKRSMREWIARGLVSSRPGH